MIFSQLVVVKCMVLSYLKASLLCLHNDFLVDFQSPFVGHREFWHNIWTKSSKEATNN